MIRLVSVAIKIYVVFLILWFVSNRLLQDSWWGLVVLDKFAEYFVFPAVFVFILSFFTKDKRVVAAAVFPLLIFLFFYGSFFLPVSINRGSSDAQYLRVATYNIWNHNQELEKVVVAAGNTNADVIALQEITDEQKQELVSLLEKKYPFYYISKSVFGGTTAMFSRYPLSKIQEIDIGIDRPSIIADIVWQDQGVTLISAHLNPSFWAYWRQPWRSIPANYLQYIKDQNAQALAIEAELDRRGKVNAVILACDCNSQETASTNRLLRKTFKDAFRTVGWQLGATKDPLLSFERNLSHIDYLWYSGGATPVSVYRGTQTAGSDHAPVIADFMIDASAKTLH